jgi:hypothetical protein
MMIVYVKNGILKSIMSNSEAMHIYRIEAMLP